MTHPARLREISSAPAPGLEALKHLDPDARVAELLDAPPGAASSFHRVDLLVIGGGSVGGVICDRAARGGARSLTIVDPGTFTVENTLTHDCGPEVLGRPKARVLGERVKALSPRTRVGVFEGRVEQLPLRFLAGVSHVLLSTDNLPAELSVFQSALELGPCVVQASVYGPTLTAQIRSIQPSPGSEGPCGGCLYTAHEWQALDAGTRFSCSGGDGGNGSLPEAEAAPTRAPAALCGLAANLAVLEVIRNAAGIGTESRMVDYCGWNHSIHVSPILRSTACPLTHARSHLETRCGLGEATPRQLLREAGLDVGDRKPRRITLSVEAHRWVGRGLCGACGAEPVLGRFLPEGELPGRCACGASLAPHPLHIHEEVPLMALDEQLDHPFGALGVPEPESVRLRADDRALRFLAPSPAGAEAPR